LTRNFQEISIGIFSIDFLSQPNFPPRRHCHLRIQHSSQSFHRQSGGLYVGEIPEQFRQRLAEVEAFVRGKVGAFDANHYS